ncbi:MAG: hypothetical protein L3J98_14900 [Gammaproteobacteria bacterium]|nr:hypothetical protein [Gammaproteobacteria bacterium]
MVYLKQTRIKKIVLNRLMRLDGVAIFGESRYWNADFSALEKNRYKLIFVSGSMTWDEVLMPMLYEIGSESIFAYAHDSSWGGDLFVTNNNGETEYIYISQKDSELDSFLYDEENDYIGTSFDQLSAIFNAKKLHNNMQDIQDKKIHMQ